MRAAGVPTPSIGSSRSPPSHTLHTMMSVVHAIFNTTCILHSLVPCLAVSPSFRSVRCEISFVRGVLYFEFLKMMIIKKKCDLIKTCR